MSRRSRGKLKRLQEKPAEKPVLKVEPVVEQQQTNRYSSYKFPKLVEFYDTQHMKMLVFTILVLVLALAQIGYQTWSTGDFLIKDISLKGGTAITFSYDQPVDGHVIENGLSQKGYTVNIRELESTGKSIGFIVTTDLDFKDDQKIHSLINAVGVVVGKTFDKSEYTIEGVDASLGQSFFTQAMKALLAAFVMMGLVVYWFFADTLKHKLLVTCVSIIMIYNILWLHLPTAISDIITIAIGILLLWMYVTTSMPSFAVVLAAFSDITITLAIVNLMGMAISAAGIAAFLMLIGYSVDTDILLSTRVLKRTHGTVLDRIISSVKTGVTMTMTTMLAVSVGIIFTTSVVIKQIMIIVLIGLIVDQFNTWIQNAAMLRLFCEKKGTK